MGAIPLSVYQPDPWMRGCRRDDEQVIRFVGDGECFSAAVLIT